MLVSEYQKILKVFDVLSENLNSEHIEFAYFDFEESGIAEEEIAMGEVEFKDSTNNKINETIYKTICNLLTLSNIEFEGELSSDCCEFTFENYTTKELNKYISLNLL